MINRRNLLLIAVLNTALRYCFFFIYYFFCVKKNDFNFWGVPFRKRIEGRCG